MNGNYNLYKNLTKAELNTYAQNMIEALETLEALKDENGEAFKNIKAIAASSKHKKLVDSWVCNSYIFFSAHFYKSARLQSQIKDLYIFGVTEDVEDIVLNIINKLAEKDGFLHPTNNKFTKSFLNVCGENVFRDVYKKYIRKSTSDKVNKVNKNPTFISTDEEIFDESGKSSITRGDLIPDLHTPELVLVEKLEEDAFVKKNYIGNYLYTAAKNGDIDLILVVLYNLTKEDIISSINTVKNGKEFLSLMNKQAEIINASLLQNICVSKMMSLMPTSTTSLLLSNANTEAKLACINDKTKEFHKDMKNMFNIKKPRKRKVIS